jgi:EAL domain-containing protein (putative c-di-GMP-specific phosphodiesterase class I)
VRFALDDFGIGVSSLQYLRDFDLDYLRMDQLFVAGVVDSPVDREIVRHAVSLGSSLGLRTIAEGVEDERQVEVLTELGCDLAQGFHFGTAEEADLIHERIEPGWVPAAAVAGDAASEGEAVTDGAPPG